MLVLMLEVVLNELTFDGEKLLGGFAERVKRFLGLGIGVTKGIEGIARFRMSCEGLKERGIEFCDLTAGALEKLLNRERKSRITCDLGKTLLD